jgi:hypothetical protein
MYLVSRIIISSVVARYYVRCGAWGGRVYTPRTKWVIERAIVANERAIPGIHDVIVNAVMAMVEACNWSLFIRTNAYTIIDRETSCYWSRPWNFSHFAYIYVLYPIHVWNQMKHVAFNSFDNQSTQMHTQKRRQKEGLSGGIEFFLLCTNSATDLIVRVIIIPWMTKFSILVNDV